MNAFSGSDAQPSEASPNHMTREGVMSYLVAIKCKDDDSRKQPLSPHDSSASGENRVAPSPPLL